MRGWVGALSEWEFRKVLPAELRFWSLSKALNGSQNFSKRFIRASFRQYQNGTVFKAMILESVDIAIRVMNGSFFLILDSISNHSSIQKDRLFPLSRDIRPFSRALLRLSAHQNKRRCPLWLLHSRIGGASRVPPPVGGAIVVSFYKMFVRI